MEASRNICLKLEKEVMHSVIVAAWVMYIITFLADALWYHFSFILIIHKVSVIISEESYLTRKTTASYVRYIMHLMQSILL